MTYGIVGYLGHASVGGSISGTLAITEAKDILSFTSSTSTYTTGWNRATIGAGGLVAGIDIAISGGVQTKICWADACGAYKFNNATGIWDQMINRGSFPSNVVGAGGIGTGGGHWRQGCFAGAIAQSDPTRIYLAYEPEGKDDPSNSAGGTTGGGAVFISTNGGASFTKTTGWGTSNAPLYANFGGIKQTTRKLAVDPINPDVVYVGYPLGQRVSYDAGTTWITVPSVTSPSATAAQSGQRLPMCGFCFDTTSGTVTNTGGTGVRTKRVYCCSPGNGIWKSEDGGATFSALAGSPDAISGATVNCAISSDGVYYVANYPKLFRYTFSSSSGLTTNTWVDISPGGGFTSVDVCTSNFSAGTVYTAHEGGNFRRAIDYGITWTGSGLAALSDATLDPKWHNQTALYFAQCSLLEDRVTAGLLWVANGIGVHTYQTPGGGVYPSSINMTPACFGIEELVVTRIISPPGGKMFSANWDRAVMEIKRDGTYPTTYGPSYVTRLGGGSTIGTVIAFTCALDWASADPTFMVCIPGGVDAGGYSSDSGVTWHQWVLNQNTAGTFSGNQVAAGSSTVQMIVVGRGGDVWYTTDNWATVNTKITSTQWNAGGATGMQNYTPMTVSGIVSGTGSVMRLTVNSTGLLTTGAQAYVENIVGTGNIGTTLNGNIFTITVVDGTHIELQGTTFGGTYTSGGNATVSPGWGGASQNTAQSLVVDRVAANTFYIPNFKPTGQGGGMYRVSFPSGVLTIARTGTVPPHTVQTLATVPNLAGSGNVSGHLWACANQYTGAIGFSRSSDEGLNWHVINGVGVTDPGSCVEAFGFGANAPGCDHPTVYVLGVINGIYGVHKGVNNIAVWNANTAVSWVQISTDQPTVNATSPISAQNQTDQVIAVSGDSNIYGQCYLGMGGMNTVVYVP